MGLELVRLTCRAFNPNVVEAYIPAKPRHLRRMLEGTTSDPYSQRRGSIPPYSGLVPCLFISCLH